MLQDEIKKKLTELQEVKAYLSKSLMNSPKGRMRYELSKGKYPQFYEVTQQPGSANGRGRYIRKSEKELIRRYAQKEYDEKLLARVSANEKSIQDFLAQYEDGYEEEIYYSMPEVKRKLIVPIRMFDEEYLEKWYREHTGGQNSYPIEKGFTTERGEVVRSKSEKMIADKLFYRNIPYSYEAPLKLDHYRVLYPDFTLLNLRTRKTYYLEHMGMMDNPEYCKKALEKIDTYEKYRIFQGEQLFVTMESSLKGIDMKKVDMIIDRFLL